MRKFGNKKTSGIAALLIIAMCFGALSGCGGKNVYPGNYSGASTPTQDSSLPEPTQGGTDIKPAREQSSAGVYEAYEEIVAQMIDQYGEFGTDPDTGGISGLKYGELIDFENDGVPEMLLLCDRELYLYGYDGSAAYTLLDVPVGSSFGQTDVSYEFRISNTDGSTYLIVDDTTDEWAQDKWGAYTVRQGGVYEIQFLAWTDGNNDTPEIEYLTDCTINGETVTQQYYLDARSTLRDNARMIDAIWDYDSATYEDLMAFEQALACAQ